MFNREYASMTFLLTTFLQNFESLINRDADFLVFSPLLYDGLYSVLSVSASGIPPTARLVFP